VSYLPQFPHFFSGTIAENIRVGNREASIAEVVEASKLAHADHFITSLPSGYNTIVGEGGLNLSGGERQRLALARIFLKKSPIILLDEPGNYLNESLEESIMASIKALSRNRSVFIASHQPVTLLASDRLSILSDGVIAESGAPNLMMPLLTDAIMTGEM
jgi:ATP-binding cassette subfamily B protein